MTILVNELRGIETVTAEKLKDLEIKDNDQLLKASTTRGQRKSLTQQNY